MDVENWKRQLRKGVLDMIILNILKGRPLYGLEMIQRLESIPELAISEGTIYPLLSRLKSDGLVFSEWVESDEGRQRKYYSLSEKGRRATDEINAAWKSFAESITNIVKKSAQRDGG